MRGPIHVFVVDKDNRALDLPLTAILAATNEPVWVHHPIGDVSVIQIPANSPYISYLRSLALDSSILADFIPCRTEELVLYGFPLSMGRFPLFSPITRRTFAASSLLFMPRADTGTFQDCFALEDTTIQGFSGGPVVKLSVYSMGNYMQIGTGPAKLFGIVHGTQRDDYGQSMAIVTPAFYLKQLVAELEAGVNN